jgi:hypothetical protein
MSNECQSSKSKMFLTFELWYLTFKSSDLFRMLAMSTIQKEIRMTVGPHLG